MVRFESFDTKPHVSNAHRQELVSALGSLTPNAAASSWAKHRCAELRSQAERGNEISEFNMPTPFNGGRPAYGFSVSLQVQIIEPQPGQPLPYF